MPKVDVNLKRGYEAKVPIERLWQKFNRGIIDPHFCIPLGEDKDKKDNEVNLADVGHIIVAGGALSGVGMFRRVALMTLLKFNDPEDLNLILIDPLKISLSNFKNIDEYLVFPIITESEGCIEALVWAKNEVDRRYNTLLENNIRNINTYNEINPLSKIPRIVIMITELGELIGLNKPKTEETEELIVTIAQMTKAVGIHFILSTQRPSTEVITPFIKANLFFKIAFQVADKIQSKNILDQEGAEKLLGQGDMLVRMFEEPARRMQGYYLEEDKNER